jgi:hypothetical protein
MKCDEERERGEREPEDERVLSFGNEYPLIFSRQNWDV